MRRFIFFLTAIAMALPLLAQTDYGIVVNGVRVTSENAEDVKGPGITGEVSYQALTNTLVLHDAKIANLISTADGLTIELEGQNSIWIIDADNASQWAGQYGEPDAPFGALISKGDLRITGSGSLQVFVANSWQWEHEMPLNAICVSNGNLTLDGCGLVEAYNQKDKAVVVDEVLTVRDACLQASGWGGNIEAAETAFVGCTMHPTQGAKVTIIGPEAAPAQFYGVMLTDIPVTTYNAASISSPFFNSGEASYDAASNTLKLDQLVVNTDDNSSGFPSKIWSFDALNVVLTGENCVAPTMGIVSGKDLRVSGSGSLELGGVQFQMRIDQLRLEGGCTFVTRGVPQGWITIQSVTVDGSTFIAGELSNEIGYIDLLKSYIVAPEWVSYDHEHHQLIFDEAKDYSNFSKEPLHISPISATAITDIDTRPASNTWHDMNGRTVSHPQTPGIFIHNGEKVIVR